MRSQGEVSEEVYIRILSKIDRDEVGLASLNCPHALLQFFWPLLASSASRREVVERRH